MALFRSSDLLPGRNRKIFIYPSPCFAFKSFKLEENPNKEAGWFFAQLVVVSVQQGIAVVLDIILECHLCFIKHRRKQLNIVSDVILQFSLTVVSQIASEMTKIPSNHT